MPVGTAGLPIFLKGSGTALIKFQIEHQGTRLEKILQISILYVPRITTWILSLGSFLKEGLCIYGDAAIISLLRPGSKQPVLQAFPHKLGESLYWV
jgi:hypothetical protein